jgi:hypothetical protein
MAKVQITNHSDACKCQLTEYSSEMYVYYYLIVDYIKTFKELRQSCQSYFLFTVKYHSF